MKDRSALLLCTSLLAATLTGGCGDKPAPIKAGSLASRIELAAGNVQVKQPGGQWQQAIAGLLLRHGAEVKVGAGDRALIRLDDGSSIFVRHGTQLVLDKAGLRLQSGEVWIDAPKRDGAPPTYHAGTVSVAAAGAGLDLRHANGEVAVYVARGLAVVSATGGRSELQSGERAIIRGKTAPKVGPVAYWEDWTGGMADRRMQAGLGGVGTGKIYALNRGRPGAPPQELEIRSQQVRVHLQDGVARTTVDQRFFNPSSTAVEGYYWFTIPEGAAIDRFALEVNGHVMDGEVVERKQARAAYEASIRMAVDPALLEWIDGRTYRARIFPIPAAGERRIVLSYLQLLPTVDDTVHYVYPMGSGGVRVQEFSLAVDLGEAGKNMQLATTADARIEGGGRRVTMRRSGYRPQGDFLLEAKLKKSAPLRAMRVESGRGEAAYVMLRYVPDVDWTQVKKVPGDVVVVVDTSAGGDQADRQLRSDVAEAILRALSTSDRFALVAADLTPRVLYPAKGLAPADEANVGKALERLSTVARGGATDVGVVFSKALARLHGARQPAVVYIGDGRPTVGELRSDGLAQRVSRTMAGSPARLFTIAVGSDCNHSLLARLARIGGGRTFRVDVAQQAVQEALRFVGSLKTPTITDLTLDVGAGLDQSFSSVAGKLSRGQEVTLLARTHHALPRLVKVTGKLGGKPFSKQYELQTLSGPRYNYVPKLWARRYLTRLLAADREKSRGTIIRLGMDYSLMTPFTSFLVLENEAAYRRWGIQRRPRDPVWGAIPHASLLEVVAAAPLSVFGCKGSTEPPNRPQGHVAKVGERRVANAPSLAARQARLARTEAATTGPGVAAPQPVVKSSLGGKRYKKARAPRDRPRKPAARHRGDKDGASGLEDERRVGGQSAAAARPMADCSDAARRPLMHRQAIWRQRLARTHAIYQALRVYRRAQARCELPHWRDRKALLELVQRRAQQANDVRILLGALRYRKAHDFVRRLLLRRAVTPALAAASLGRDPIDWSIAGPTLDKASPAQRLVELRKLLNTHPSSQGAALRLLTALLSLGKAEEALAVALKLRADGMATPALMQRIGDLLAAAGRPTEARRAYSEVVEFAPNDPAARQLLGDICLRHGWYESAYRQYKTLTQLRTEDPLALLRLAAAAAGAGRVDEALRLERRVSAGQGEPGPRDPRRWARLASAARIAKLMISPPKNVARTESLRQSMERSLRRLQVLVSPGVLYLLSWEDLQARLSFDILAGGQSQPRTDTLAADPIGLTTITSARPSTKKLTARIARVAGARQRALRFQVHVIVWDGQRMRVAAFKGEIPARPANAPAGEPVDVELSLP